MTSKVCQICGEDCSARPRVRDGEGRYACKACLEKKQRQRRAGGDKPGAAPATPAPDDDGDLLIQLVAENPQAQAAPCPQCGGRIDPGNVICTNCGFNTATGQVVQTKVMKAEKPRRQRSGGKSKDFSGVAIWQRRLIMTVLLLIVATVVFSVALVMNLPSLADPDTGHPSLDATYKGPWLLARLGILAVQLWAVICCIGMMRSLRWPIAAIIPLTLVLILPCVGLITLLVLNGVATSALRRNGWRVGILGVK